MHSSIDGHFSCSHLLATLNNAAMNIGVHICFQIFVFFRKIPRSRVCTICFFESISAIVIIAPFEDRLPGTVGPDYIMSPPFSPILLWFFLYILSFGIIFSVSLQVVLTLYR